ncbi:MAG: hypothetical protein U0V70_09105 [Terriglobia bacterium]
MKIPSHSIIIPIPLALLSLFLSVGKAGTIQKDVPGKTPSVASSASAMSVDDSRLLVKAIPSVDIPKTLARWKLQETELVNLRQWSQMLVENSARNDLTQKWVVFIQQVGARNKETKVADLSPLIQMLMLAAYDQAQKEIASGVSEGGGKTKLRKQFASTLQENLTRANEIESLSRFSRREMTDPVAGSGLGLPTVQRMLRQCQLVEKGEGKVECKDILVSTDYELKNYITSTANQLKQVQETLRHTPEGGDASEGLGKARLYALSETARQMHDAALPYLKK